MKEHPVPFATQQWADGLLHIISLTAKVHRATQEHSCRASTREVCSVLMCFRAFKRFPLGLQIGLGIVVGGVQADMPKPTPSRVQLKMAGARGHPA